MLKIKIVGFAWDKWNKDKNWIKHEVKVKECEDVFYNRPIFFQDKTHSQKENRFVAYGISDLGRKLTIIFTIRKKLIRVISARDQNKKERSIYETNRKKNTPV